MTKLSDILQEQKLIVVNKHVISGLKTRTFISANREFTECNEENEYNREIVLKKK